MADEAIPFEVFCQKVWGNLQRLLGTDNELRDEGARLDEPQFDRVNQTMTVRGEYSSKPWSCVVFMGHGEIEIDFSELTGEEVTRSAPS